MTDALEQQGFTVVEFHHLDNDEDAATLISALKLTGYVKSSKSFTYADKDYRLVFVHRG